MSESTHGGASPADQQLEERRDFFSYALGLGLALLLTWLAFALVQWTGLVGPPLFVALGLLALIQMAVHFRFFMHIGIRRKREDLQLILFTGLLVIIMVGGTVWIMVTLAARMAMPAFP